MALLDQHVHTTGTVMSNRQGLPPQIKNKHKLSKGDTIAWTRQNKEMALSWKDKRVVNMLSTYYDIGQTVIQRRTKNGGTEDITKPNAVIEYTKHMGAVDRFDHYCNSYSFTRKSLKWWKKTFFWLLEVAVVNSFILYKEIHSDKVIDHIQYRKELIQQLVSEQRASQPIRRRGRPSTLDAEERLDRRQHFIAQFSEKKTKDCAVCSDRKTPGQRRQTVFYCETCSRQPGLHPGTCFKKYHTMAQYK